MIGFNASDQEVLDYGTPEQIKAHFQMKVDLNEQYLNDANTKKKINNLERRLETAVEQVYFAKDLLEAIRKTLRSETRAKDMKVGILSIIENSYFEE